MLSFGIDASRAFWIASARPALPSRSPPPSRAATVIARASFVKCWPRRASTAAFLCLIECHLEWTDIAVNVTEYAVGSEARGAGTILLWARVAVDRLRLQASHWSAIT